MNPIMCFSPDTLHLACGYFDHPSMVAFLAPLSHSSRGQDALFVAEDRAFERSKRYMPLFQKMDPESAKIEVFRKDKPAHALSVFRDYGFKGKVEEK